MPKARVAIALGAVLLLSGFASAWFWHKPISRETLSVARVSLPMTALTSIAEGMGYFSQEGVDVSFSDFVTGREALDSMNEGHQDLSIAFTTPIVHDIAEGKDDVILTCIHESEQNTAVVALANRGIETPKDLRGKTVGVAMGTSGEFFLGLFLADAGMTAGDVVTADIKTLDLVPALKAGQVDAVVVWNPYLAEAQAAYPPEAIRVFRTAVYQEMSLLAGPREVVNRKGEAIGRFLRALSRAEDLLIRDPAQARLVQSRQTKGAAHLDPGSPIWNDFTPVLGLNHVLLLSLEQDAEWLRAKGSRPTPLPQFRRQIDDHFLREVRPDAVTLPSVSGFPNPVAAKVATGGARR